MDNFYTALGRLDYYIEQRGDACLHWLWRGPGVSPAVPLNVLYAMGFAGDVLQLLHHLNPFGLIFTPLGFVINVSVIGMSLARPHAWNAQLTTMRARGSATLLRAIGIFPMLLFVAWDLLLRYPGWVLASNAAYGFYWWLLWSLRPTGPRGRFKLPKLSWSQPRVAYAYAR